MARNEKTQTYWHGPGNVRIGGKIYKPGMAIPVKGISDEKRAKWLESSQTGEAPFSIDGSGEMVSEIQRLKNQVKDLSEALVSVNVKNKDLETSGAGFDPADKRKIETLSAKITDLEKQVDDLSKPVKTKN